MLSISNKVKYFNNSVESLHNLNDFTDDIKNTEILIGSKLRVKLGVKFRVIFN
jgi:hypothetical protein